MCVMKRIGLAVIVLACTATREKSDDQELPLKPNRTIEFTTTVGSGMSVDVSPDGQTIIFDLLGDLYTLPISGGSATQLTRGLAWDQLPKFSPDGRQIAFVSDRNGITNLWVMDRDGTNARRVSPYTPR
jgi:Tol biopolymer transport system component